MNSTTCAACPTGWTSVGGSSRCQSVSFVFPVLLLSCDNILFTSVL
jgi:hypothetical protein